MSNELAPGQKILQYEVISLLGAGGMSRVYLCEDLVLNRRVALKQLLSAETDHRNAMRLQQEGQALARLQHPNIVQIYTYFATDNGAPFLVMELLHGYSLQEHLEQHGSLTVSEVVQLSDQVCSALEQAHELGIVHRDIKPSNIFLFNKKISSVKLIDFGIAKSVDSSVNTTRTGEFVGSPTYISPEQALQKPVTASSDQYSLACVLYECLTGKPPFVDESAMRLIMMHVQDAAPTIGKGTFVTPAISKAIERALKKEPDERFSSITAFNNALHGKVAAGDSRKPGFIIGIAIGTTLMLGLGIFTFLLMDNSNSTKGKTAKVASLHSANLADLPMPDTRKLADETFVKQYQPTTNWTVQYIEQMIGRNPQTEAINLPGKGLDDAGLDALLSAKKCKTMGLNKTGIGDEAADVLVSMKTLQVIDVSKDPVTNVFVQKICSLPALKVLSLTDTNVTTSGAKYFKDSPTIETVIMRACKIDDSIAKDFLKVRNIKEIDLCDCDIGDEFVRTISSSKTVEMLALTRTRVTSASFSALPKMPGLRRLFLDTIGEITDVSPLLDIPLTVLSLRKNQLSADQIQKLAKIKTLVKLRLSEDPVTDEDLIAFAQMPNLRSLDVNKCRLLTPQGIAKFHATSHNKIKLIAEDVSSDEARLPSFEHAFESTR